MTCKKVLLYFTFSEYCYKKTELALEIKFAFYDFSSKLLFAHTYLDKKADSKDYEAIHWTS